MKLFYLDFPNVGDQLNPWLWHRLLPGVFDEDASVSFVGIGTLLNHKLHLRIPDAKKILVFGTGVGYTRSGLPIVDESWKIYCVRGPKSAQALSLPPNYAVTDPGVLVRKFIINESSKKYRFSYMPHVDQAEVANLSWQFICNDLGYGYIDPRSSVDSVLNQINQTEILLTEAMHGAIFADTLRVPWIPIITSGSISRFKWEDYCLSVNLPYSPALICLPSSWKEIMNALMFASFPQNRLRTILINDLLDKGFFKQRKYWLDLKLIQIQLSAITKRCSPFISSETVIKNLINELELRLSEFKNDIINGSFNDGVRVTK